MFLLGTSFSTNNDLVDYVARSNPMSADVIRAMKAVDRAKFCIPQFRDEAYADMPLPLCEGQTISAPHMHGTALELLSSRLRPGCRFLDIGSGSGIMCAYAAEMTRVLTEPRACIVGVEIVKAVYDMGVKFIHGHNPLLLEAPNFKLILGSGWESVREEGEEGFDSIHVGAAADGIPMELLSALNPNGLMMLPFGHAGSFQWLLRIRKLAISDPAVLSKIPELVPDDDALARHVRARVLEDESNTFLVSVPKHGAFEFSSITGVAFVPLVKEVGEIRRFSLW